MLPKTWKACSFAACSFKSRHALFLKSYCVFTYPSLSPFLLFPSPFFFCEQLIKVCLRTPLRSSRVPRPRGQGRPRPGAPRRRLIPTRGPAAWTRPPLEDSRGWKMPLTWARQSGQRLVRHKQKRDIELSRSCILLPFEISSYSVTYWKGRRFKLFLFFQLSR